ncbi:unnamed protein product, partial [Closterium sp. NIES-65]
MASQRPRAGDGRSEGVMRARGEGASAGGGMGRPQGGGGTGGGDGRERAMGEGEGGWRGKMRGVGEEGDGRGSGRGASRGLAGLETAGARESVVLVGAAAWVVARVALRGVLPGGTVAAMAAVWAAAVGAECRGWGAAFHVLQPRLGASSPGLHLAAITPSAAIAAVCALHRSAPLSTPPSFPPWLLVLLHASLATSLTAVAGTAAAAGHPALRRAALEQAAAKGGTAEDSGGGEEGGRRGHAGGRRRGGGREEGSDGGRMDAGVGAFERRFFGAWLAAGAAAVLLLCHAHADVAWRMAAGEVEVQMECSGA